MAGGMHPGRSGRRSLGERALDSGVRQTVSDPVPRPAGEATEGRHCWVHDPPEAPGTWPGLLVEWQQREGGWQGRVTYAVAGPHGPALVESWLPAARLEPR
ncbi:hypothetical protein [Blastococcus saxobsidens]|uniref:Uncharacterized protein n=1 Tax=Blastococcus saxobsidens (strain DD2) TaxID=1146883 RepID=H6RVM3_BLASD|nr:hypothetical protein [Blastococcus saxobsidens]CCG03298.1 conserved protein of unknown function [Blastococcus saxobsidens DD2]